MEILFSRITKDENTNIVIITVIHDDEIETMVCVEKVR